MVAIGVQHYFGRVVEEHTGHFVGQVIAQTVFGGVVDPFLNPDLSFAGLNDLAAIILCLRGLGDESIGSPSDLIVLSCSDQASSGRSDSLSGGQRTHSVFLFTPRTELVDISLGRRTSQGRWRQQSGDGATVIDPRMRHDLVNRWSSGRVIIQNFGNKVPCRFTDSDLLWERVAVHSDSLVGGLDVIGFKWRLSDDESVNDDAERPYIDFIRVSLLTFENLWSDVVGCTTNRPLSLSIKLELGRKTKITDFDLHLVVEEEVTEFEISVDDSMRV